MRFRRLYYNKTDSVDSSPEEKNGDGDLGGFFWKIGAFFSIGFLSGCLLDVVFEKMNRREYDSILDAVKDPSFPQNDAVDADLAQDLDDLSLSRSSSMPSVGTNSTNWHDKAGPRYATVTAGSMSVHRGDDRHGLKTRINKARKSLDKSLSRGTNRSKKEPKLVRLGEDVNASSFFSACSYSQYRNGQQARRIRSKILQSISKWYFGIDINALLARDRRSDIPLVETPRKNNEFSRIKRAWQSGEELRRANGKSRRGGETASTEKDEVFYHVKGVWREDEPADPYLEVSVAADVFGMEIVVYWFEYDADADRGELKQLWKATPPPDRRQKMGELPVCYVVWICGYQCDLLVPEGEASEFKELGGKFAGDVAREDPQRIAHKGGEDATISESREPYPLERLGWNQWKGEQFLEFQMPSTNRQERMTMLPEETRPDGRFETSRSGFSLMGTEHRLETYKRPEGQSDALKLDKEKKECRDCTVCTPELRFRSSAACSCRTKMDGNCGACRFAGIQEKARLQILSHRHEYLSDYYANESEAKDALGKYSLEFKGIHDRLKGRFLDVFYGKTILQPVNEHLDAPLRKRIVIPGLEDSSTLMSVKEWWNTVEIMEGRCSFKSVYIVYHPTALMPHDTVSVPIFLLLDTEEFSTHYLYDVCKDFGYANVFKLNTMSL